MRLEVGGKMSKLVDSLFEYKRAKRIANCIRERQALFGIVGELLWGV